MSFTRKEFLLSLLVATTTFLSGCKRSGNEPDPNPQPTYLVSSTPIKSFTRDELSQQIAQINPGLSLFVRSGVSAHKLVYNTKLPDGTSVTASGAIIIPSGNTTAVPMVSQQHGTIESDASAPSNFGPSSDAAYAGTLFASLGFIMVCPDYIGYGESKAIPHTYEHREGLATASLDMIRAAKEFIKQNNVSWDDRLFLTGYSEGGYATMSLQKKIEEEFPTEFNLRGSTMGSGAYDKTATMNYIINQKTSGNASSNRLYLWVLQTYNSLYKLNRPMSYYLKEPYATQAEANGKNVTINVSISDVFTDSFKKAVNDGTDTGFMNAVKDNDVYDWKPKTPTKLYYGDADDLVFPFNTVNAYKAMQARGATSVLPLELTKGGTHSSTVTPYLLGTYTFFSTMQ